jgi:hypothetical protein
MIGSQEKKLSSISYCSNIIFFRKAVRDLLGFY